MSFADRIASTDRLVEQHFGETVRYASSEYSGDSYVDVRAVFTERYRRVESNLQGQVISSIDPAVFLTLSDLTDAGFDPEAEAADARVTRSGVVYRVREVQPDGDGGLLLLLVRRE